MESYKVVKENPENGSLGIFKYKYKNIYINISYHSYMKHKKKNKFYEEFLRIVIQDEFETVTVTNNTYTHELYLSKIEPWWRENDEKFSFVHLAKIMLEIDEVCKIIPEIVSRNFPFDYSEKNTENIKNNIIVSYPEGENK